MDIDASKLAQVFKDASREGILEKPFRDEVEKHLLSLAAELKLDLNPHKEVTLGSGVAQR